MHIRSNSNGLIPMLSRAQMRVLRLLVSLLVATASQAQELSFRMFGTVTDPGTSSYAVGDPWEIVVKVDAAEPDDRTSTSIGFYWCTGYGTVAGDSLDGPVAYIQTLNAFNKDSLIFAISGTNGTATAEIITTSDLTWIGGDSLADVPVSMPAGAQTSFNWLGVFGTVDGVEMVVLSPATMIENLIASTQEINLHHGISNALDSKLNNALDAWIAQEEDVVDRLLAFINSVEAQRDKKITNAEADFLVGEANAIINVILGP